MKLFELFKREKHHKKEENSEAFPNLEETFHALIITDTHGHIKSLEPFLENIHKIDVIFTLGDLDFRDYEFLKTNPKLCNIKKYGVLGNHDYFNDLKNNNIESIHGKLITYKGITITGMYGSHKYKNVNAPMFTDEESEQIANLLPPCDLFITHDWIKHKDMNNETKKGLTGITKYINMHSPAYHIHGHIHENLKEEINKTISFGFCRYAYLEINKNGIIILKRYGDIK